MAEAIEVERRRPQNRIGGGVGRSVHRQVARERASGVGKDRVGMREVARPHHVIGADRGHC